MIFPIRTHTKGLSGFWRFFDFVHIYPSATAAEHTFNLFVPGHRKAFMPTSGITNHAARTRLAALEYLCRLSLCARNFCIYLYFRCYSNFASLHTFKCIFKSNSISQVTNALWRAFFSSINGTPTFTPLLF